MKKIVLVVENSKVSFFLFNDSLIVKIFDQTSKSFFQNSWGKIEEVFLNKFKQMEQTVEIFCEAFINKF